MGPSNSSWPICPSPGGLAEGWLEVPIAGVFLLAEAAERQRRLEGRGVSGELLPEAGV